jgi:superfamily I DNA/RNA helicase
MTTPAFTSSPEQQNVLAHRGGHLQIVACAGAGKIEAISRWVSTLIGEGVEPAQIVAVAFTERAGTSLKDRVTCHVAGDKGHVIMRGRDDGPLQHAGRQVLQLLGGVLACTVDLFGFGGLWHVHNL